MSRLHVGSGHFIRGPCGSRELATDRSESGGRIAYSMSWAAIRQLRFFARALHVFGEIKVLEQLLDPATQDAQRMYELPGHGAVHPIPRRCRARGRGLGTAIPARGVQQS